jgi:hypothetical protein
VATAIHNPSIEKKVVEDLIFINGEVKIISVGSEL